MSAWLKSFANNSLSYLQTQVTVPLRIRKSGKSVEEVRKEIKNELKTTISREKDVERQISQTENAKKAILSQRQELNFRVQNLDENRQFLFRQCSDYECKLEKAANKQRALLENKEKLQFAFDELSLKLRSIALNLKGANELKESTLTKIPKLEENRRQLQKKLTESTKSKSSLSCEIDAMCEKRDELRKQTTNAQSQYNLLLDKKAKQGKQLNNISSIEVLNSENETKVNNNSSNNNNNNNNNNDNSLENELQQARKTLHNLHTELSEIEKRIENENAMLGRIMLNKVNFEKELQRMADMVMLQQQSLESMEKSRGEYIKQEKQLVYQRNKIENDMKTLDGKLTKVKDEMRNYKDDIEAIEEASKNLTQKKQEFAEKLKKTLSEQEKLTEKLKILNRNRMTLRARKTQLIKDQNDVDATSYTLYLNQYTSESVNVLRCDLKKSIKGELILSKEQLIFNPIVDDDNDTTNSNNSNNNNNNNNNENKNDKNSDNNNEKPKNDTNTNGNTKIESKSNDHESKHESKNNNGKNKQLSIRHRVVDISHSHCNPHTSEPDRAASFKIYLLPYIKYQRDKSMVKRRKGHHHSSNNNNNNSKNNEEKDSGNIKNENENKFNNKNHDNESDYPYYFKCNDSSDVSKLESMHRYLKARRALEQMSQTNTKNRNGGATNRNRNDHKNGTVESNSGDSKDILNIDGSNKKEMMNGNSNHLKNGSNKNSNNGNNSTNKSKKNDFDEEGSKSRTYSLVPPDVEFNEKSDIVENSKLREVVLKCPSRTHMWRWKLYYSCSRHGISMNTFYANCQDIEESLLMIKDQNGNIFGAYLDVDWSISSDYRGSIDCFVFEIKSIIAPAKNEKKPEKQEKGIKKKREQKLIVYKSSGKKPYVLKNDFDSITVGAGECPALYIDSDLNLGRSAVCQTFDSPCLSDQTSFRIQELEIWGPEL